jgi:hypothetical protein
MMLGQKYLFEPKISNVMSKFQAFLIPHSFSHN